MNGRSVCVEPVHNGYAIHERENYGVTWRTHVAYTEAECKTIFARCLARLRDGMVEDVEDDDAD